MSAALLNQPTTGAGVIEGALLTPLALPDALPHFSLSVTAAGLSYDLNAPVIGVPVIDHDRFVAEFALDRHVVLILTLFGERSADGTEFRASRYLLNCKRTEPRVRAEFVRSSILAILGFAGRIGLKIPDLAIDTLLAFNLPLQEISHQLQLRQLAYRLMVIEQATGSSFLLPEISSHQEIEFANRLYYAIVNRSVVGPIDPVEEWIPAGTEALAWLDSYSNASTQILGPVPISMKLFNQTISLGNVSIVVNDAFIVDADRIRAELSANDGHLVGVVISSLSGQGLYQTPEAPQLVISRWDSTVEVLLDLEEQFDRGLSARYHTLAAETLNGLTEDQRIEITRRPELDPEAFIFHD